MAADSRLTLNTKVPSSSGTKDLSIEFSNSNNKLFCTQSGVGIAICGDAGIKGNPIAGYIDDFTYQHPESSPTEVADQITSFLKKDNPNLNSILHIGGYDKDGKQSLFRVFTSSGKASSIDTALQGVLWNGELDVIQRLISDMWYSDPSGLPSEKVPRYEIPWSYFSLQDAIDFVRYAMETTIGAIRFQDRPKTVGGPVDVLAIRRNGPVWVQRKTLSFGASPRSAAHELA